MVTDRSFRVVTEESRLGVLDIVSDLWPCDARTISAVLYPNPLQCETGRNHHRIRRICLALERDDLIRPWSVGPKGQIGWAPADAPSFSELYLRATS